MDEEPVLGDSEPEEDEVRSLRSLIGIYGVEREAVRFHEVAEDLGDFEEDCCEETDEDHNEAAEDAKKEALSLMRSVVQERDRFHGYLSSWQKWSRELHHGFGWLDEFTWPDDTKGREKIEHELKRLQRILKLGVECPDCGGTGIGPTVMPAPGESAETGWCPTCEGGGSVTKEYMRLRNKKE